MKSILEYIDVGKQEGRVVAGGDGPREGGYFVPPTIIADVDSKARIFQEEIFGPVVSVTTFKTDEGALSIANDTLYGLGAGIWTRDISKAHALAKKLRAGTVWINCYNVFDASLPFGGYKQSGWGREMGHEVLNNYTEVKAVTTLL